MKNVLLLGGNGFLGRKIAEYMSKIKTYNVYVFDVSLPEKPIDNVTYFVGSIENISYLFAILEGGKIDILVHMVSTLIPGSTLDQYVDSCKLVYIPSISIIDYCSKNKIKLVYFSSGGTVYGVKEGVISEDEPTSPISYYGLSKVQVEDLIYFYHDRYGLDYLIIRPSNPYGFGQNLYGKQGLIAVILGKVLKGEVVSVFGNGEIVRDYIYIDDLVYYITELLEIGVVNETINIGSGEGNSINQIINIIKKVIGVDIKIEYLPARADDVPIIVLDTRKLQLFVKHENHTIEDGIGLFYNMVKGKK